MWRPLHYCHHQCDFNPHLVRIVTEDDDVKKRTEKRIVRDQTPARRSVVPKQFLRHCSWNRLENNYKPHQTPNGKIHHSMNETSSDDTRTPLTTETNPFIHPWTSRSQFLTTDNWTSWFGLFALLNIGFSWCVSPDCHSQSPIRR